MTPSREFNSYLILAAGVVCAAGAVVAIMGLRLGRAGGGRRAQAWTAAGVAAFAGLVMWAPAVVGVTALQVNAAAGFRLSMLAAAFAVSLAAAGALPLVRTLPRAQSALVGGALVAAGAAFARMLALSGLESPVQLDERVWVTALALILAALGAGAALLLADAPDGLRSCSAAGALLALSLVGANHLALAAARLGLDVGRAELGDARRLVVGVLVIVACALALSGGLFVVGVKAPAITGPVRSGGARRIGPVSGSDREPDGGLVTWKARRASAAEPPEGDEG